MVYPNDMKRLIDQLNEWTKFYDKGCPIVSDKDWDSAYFKLEEMEKESGIIYPNSPTQKVDFKTVSALNKVEHNHPMLSLGKTKDLGEVRDFVKGQDWLAMFKMDGLTCSLRYFDGKLVSAETRGNGEVGEDITHNALVIKNIPKTISYKDELIVDGEIICDYGSFKEFENEYKNPRNFAAGSIRQLSSKEAYSRNLSFVAWDLIKGYDDIDFFFWRLEKLDDLGFTTVPRVGDAETVDDAIEILNNMRTEFPYASYPIDGYVFRFESQKYYESCGKTDHHFRGAFAYKFYDEEYDSELLDIELSVGRTGVLTPVAIFEPIDMDGSTIERASLHNLSVMTNIVGAHPYIGQKIKVVKQNMIIPQLTWADTDEKNIDWDNLIKMTSCPACGSSFEVRDNDGVITIWCTNPNCEGKLINRLDHFCGKKGLDIKGISRKTIEKLIDWGWVNKLKDIFTLEQHKSEWIAKPGFGAASVDKILKAIDNAKENVTLETFISSLGIPLVGKVVAKTIAKEFESWQDFRDYVDTDDSFFDVFEGIGEEIDNSIKYFNYTEADEVAGIFAFKQPEVQEEVLPAAAINGKKFCVTGKLNNFTRDSIKADIESFGGKVVGSVTSTTDYLITNTPNSGTAKNRDAQRLGVKIITEDDYLQMKV